jgi:predicted Rossmann fold nucleotide-binding protein DprA/Smf involved in DNA uptake
VLESLGLESPPTGDPDGGPLLDLLPATADELVQKTGLSAGQVTAALAELDVAGLAKEGDGIYRRLA